MKLALVKMAKKWIFSTNKSLYLRN